jgi:hypothetical protein
MLASRVNTVCKYVQATVSNEEHRRIKAVVESLGVSANCYMHDLLMEDVDRRYAELVRTNKNREPLRA